MSSDKVDDGETMPPYRPQLNYWEKGKKKCMEQPLVPIGALVTVGFLANGLRAFHRGDRKNQQFNMRGRVAAQAFTVLAMLYGAFVVNTKPDVNPNIEAAKENVPVAQKIVIENPQTPVAAKNVTATAKAVLNEENKAFVQKDSR